MHITVAIRQTAQYGGHCRSLDTHWNEGFDSCSSSMRNSTSIPVPVYHAAACSVGGHQECCITAWIVPICCVFAGLKACGRGEVSARHVVVYSRCPVQVLVSRVSWHDPCRCPGPFRSAQQCLSAPADSKHLSWRAAASRQHPRRQCRHLTCGIAAAMAPGSVLKPRERREAAAGQVQLPAAAGGWRNIPAGSSPPPTHCAAAARRRRRFQRGRMRGA